MASRILILAAIVLAVCSAAAAQLTCLADEAKCADDECCVKIGMVGLCKKLLEADKLCEVKPAKHILIEHLYLHMCPCGDGLKCKGKEGLLGRFLSRCEEYDGEVDAVEGPDGLSE